MSSPITIRFMAAMAGKPASVWRGLDIKQNLFSSDPMAEQMFLFTEQFVREHGKVPSAATLTEQFKTSLPKETADAEWLFVKLQERRVKQRLGLVSEEVAKLIVEDPVRALTILSEESNGLMGELKRITVSDFKNAAEDAWPWLLAKWSGQLRGAPMPWPYMSDIMGDVLGGEVVSTAGRPGLGKAQPIDAKILLANGCWKTMGAIQVGDLLASVDGQPSKVEALFPQGRRPIYEVETADGRIVEADQDHLWEVHSSKWPAPRTVTTLEMARLLERVRYEGRINIPALSGEFGRPAFAPDPYVLGLLIGDGCFRSEDVRLTSADPEVVEQVRQRVPQGYNVASNGIEHRISANQRENEFKHWLIEHGLWGKLSKDKHVPEEVFTWRRGERYDFLAGLFDSDGWCSGGVTEFGSSSLQLAKDVQRLCWSLGMSASLNTGTNNSWRVNLQRDNGLNPFKLSRKRDRHAEIERQTKQTLVKVVAVRPAGVKECQCIRVSHPRALYVTNDYLVTHNTWSQLKIALHIWNTLDKPVVFFSMEIMARKIMERLIALYTETPADFFKHGLSANLFSKSKKTKIYDQLVELQGSDRPPFLIVDANLTSTTDDVQKICQQYGAAAAVIDGAYMLRVPGKARLKGFEKIEEICYGLKRDVATGLDIPAFASWQLNRDAGKLKPGQPPELEMIAGGDTIGQISSCVMALMDEPMHTEGNPAAARRRRIYLIKGRDGEEGDFAINWDFVGMNFDQIQDGWGGNFEYDGVAA